MTAAGAQATSTGLHERVNETLIGLSRTGMLPTLPHVATAALQIIREPDADADKLCAVIRTDVGLAACLMRLANSVAYARRQSANTLREAVLTIGLSKTCHVLIAAGARKIYGGAGKHAEALWSHSLATAIATQELAKTTRLVDPANVFLPGLFHDVGRIAFLLADWESFEVIQRLADTGESPRMVLEAEWYGFDHAEAGSILGKTWGLNPEQCDALRWHHDPTQAGSGARLAALLNAADALAYGIDQGVGAAPPPGVSMAQLGLPEAEQATCLERVRAAFAEQQEMFDS